MSTVHELICSSIIATGTSDREVTKKKSDKCKENQMKLLKTEATITTVLELLLWGLGEGRWHVEEPKLGLGQAWGMASA